MRAALTPFLSHFVGSKISNLIASEIIRNEDINARVSTIEKWVAVADICRCLHNYNAVLEITSSMNRSAIFRLKKTWLKVSKQVRGGRPVRLLLLLPPAGVRLGPGACTWSLQVIGSHLSDRQPGVGRGRQQLSNTVPFCLGGDRR